MKLRDQPDFRISDENVSILTGVERLEGLIVHNRPGCPRVSAIQVFNGYLRCSQCFTPLTPHAASTIVSVAKHDEPTNSFRTD